MKYRSNLRSRIMLFALVPGLVCSLLIGIYLTYALVRDITLYEQRMGDAYSEQISAQSFDALREVNQRALQHIAQLSLEYPLVRAVSFYDAHQQPLVHAGPRHNSIAHTDIPPFSNHPVHIDSNDSRQLFVPVTLTRLAVPDSGTPDTHGSSNEPVGWLRMEFSRSFMLLHKYQTILIDVVIVTAVLACAFWMATPFSDRLAGTLRELSLGATAISEGNTRILLPTSDISEIQEISHAIATMRDAFIDQQSGLQQHIEQSTHDLRETLETIEIQNIELDLARREAVQASKVKSEFLANTSHEIRTPLNSIIGFSKLLLKTQLSAQQHDFLVNIRKSSENLLTIINDVLDLSKIEAGKLVLDYTPFDIHDTLEEILQILAPGAHEKGIELLHMIYSDVPNQLMGDPLRLKQILTNLISNAIKFSEQGSIVVRISTENRNDQQALLRVEVTDSGMGLPNNNQMIFNAFTQLDSSSTREYSGTGLGLAISRRLAEQMGGDIGYQSEPGNTTFWFTVRLDTARTSSNAPERIHLRNRSILVYDKESLCRLAISHSLTAWGIQPVLADSIEQVIPAMARHAGSEQPIDAAILGLPVRHNQQELEQLLQSIQVLSQQYRCPIVLCIPTSAKHILADTLHGNIENLPKPVTEKRLYQTLCHALLPDEGAARIQTQATSSNTPQSRITVLAVDDNPSNLKLISTMLRDLGTHVLEAHNGHEAVRLFQEHAIDLVFMDIQMPIMDGIEATRKIRQLDHHAGGRHTPVIALTAHALTEQRQHLLMSGLDDYLSKPASEQQLLRMLEKWQEKIRSDQNSSVTGHGDSHTDGRSVNRAEALKTSGGRPHIAAEMLGLLLNTLDEERKVINDAIATGDLESAEAHVHKLHGTSCYCGVPELKNCCNALEALLKKKMLDHISDVLARFNMAVDQLLSWHSSHDINAFFENTDEANTDAGHFTPYPRRWPDP